jgi:hypothetical protein
MPAEPPLRIACNETPAKLPTESFKSEIKVTGLPSGKPADAAVKRNVPSDCVAGGS